MSNTPSKAEIEALVKRHGATSYRNRADTQHPAYGFTEDGLNGLIDEVLAKWGTPPAEQPVPNTGHAEADRLIGRLMSSDPDFEDCRQAAELIQREIKGPDGFGTWREAAIAERLARVNQQAAPKQEAQEPVAWQGVHDQTDLYYTKPLQADVRPLYAAPRPAPAPLSEREAFEAWIEKDGGDLGTFGTPPNMHYRNSSVNNAWVAWKARAVLAKWGTPQPVVREPLTDAQIAEMMRDTWGCASIAPRHALEFARAIERAHGITQKGGS